MMESETSRENIVMKQKWFILQNFGLVVNEEKLTFVIKFIKNIAYQKSVIEIIYIELSYCVVIFLFYFYITFN